MNKNDGGGGSRCNRGRGVHHNAQRAVVGIAGVLVDVGHLDEGEKGKQEQAQKRYRDAQRAPLGNASRDWLEPYQQLYPLLTEYTGFDAKPRGWITELFPGRSASPTG